MDDTRLEALPAGQPESRPARTRHRSIVGPLLLIVVGMLFLGQNLGVIPAGIWLDLWRLWPVVLVLIGLELILGRTGIGSAVATIILFLVVLAFVATLAFFGLVGGWRFAGHSLGDYGYDGYSYASALAGTEQVTEELNDTQRATVDLQHGAGQLTVESLPADSTQLIDADLSYGSDTTVSRNISRQGDLATVQLRGQTRGNAFPLSDGFRQDWQVRLSPRVPLELTVQSGASDMALDLSHLDVTRLNVQAGASSLKVSLPEKAGQTQAQIKTGAAGVDITVPEGVAARIHVQGGLSGTDVDESRFPHVSNYYQSPNYDTAQNRVDLTVESGVSGVTIR